MDKIWDRNPLKSEVIGRCGRDEKTEWPRYEDTMKTAIAFILIELQSIWERKNKTLTKYGNNLNVTDEKNTFLLHIQTFGIAKTVHEFFLFSVATPKNSPLWEKINQAIEEKVENIHTVCDTLFPTTPSQVKSMLQSVQFNQAWIPSQVRYSSLCKGNTGP